MLQNEWTLRRAVDDDAHHMFAVLVDAVKGLTGGEYTLAQQTAWVNSVSREYFSSIIALEQHDIWVAEWSDQIVAFGALHVDEVSYLYVRSAYANKGLGSHLLHTMERTAFRRGERRLHLRSSVTARAFYERHGFAVSQRVMLVRSGVRIPSIVMEKDLPRSML